MKRVSRLVGQATALLLLAGWWGASAHAHKGCFNMGAQMNVQMHMQQQMHAQQQMHTQNAMMQHAMMQHHGMMQHVAMQQHANMQNQMMQHHGVMQHVVNSQNQAHQNLVHAHTSHLTQQQGAVTPRSSGQQTIARGTPSQQTGGHHHLGSSTGKNTSAQQGLGPQSQMQGMTCSQMMAKLHSSQTGQGQTGQGTSCSQMMAGLRSSQMMCQKYKQDQTSSTGNGFGSPCGMHSMKWQGQNSQLARLTQQGRRRSQTTQTDTDGDGCGCQGGSMSLKGGLLLTHLPKQPVFPGLSMQGSLNMVMNQPQTSVQGGLIMPLRPMVPPLTLLQQQNQPQVVVMEQPTQPQLLLVGLQSNVPTAGNQVGDSPLLPSLQNTTSAGLVIDPATSPTVPQQLLVEIAQKAPSLLPLVGKTLADASPLLEQIQQKALPASRPGDVGINKTASTTPFLDTLTQAVAQASPSPRTVGSQLRLEDMLQAPTFRRAPEPVYGDR